jgi:ABC-2 type transport system ATP-binding protein
MNSIISIKNFSKSFGKVKVIKDLSFEVSPGEIFAFVGANGSGKTTTIRSLLGIYQADAGELLVNGKKYDSDDSAILGYLPEERGLYISAKVLETMVYFGEIKGMSNADATEAARQFLKKVELADKEKETINKLSSGQQQKIQLGITIINKPKLLILDEPTKGLDPVNRSLLLDLLMELNKSGSTIVFSTHQMEEAEKIADRLLMIKDGEAALYGDVDDIKNAFGDNTIFISFKGKFPTNEKLYQASVTTHSAEVSPKDGVKPTEILGYLVKEGLEISQFEISSPSLNEIFLRVTKGDIPEKLKILNQK